MAAQSSLSAMAICIEEDLIKDAVTMPEKPEDLPINLDDVFKKLDMETRTRLQSAFLSKGRGRRANMPQFDKCTHAVLLQIYFLKTKNDKSWEDVHSWVQELFPGYPPHIFRTMIENVVKTVMKCQNIDNFLEIIIDLDYIGDQCNSLGITRKKLMNVNDLVELPTITKGFLNELDLFCKRQHLDLHFMFLVLNKLKPDLFSSTSQLSKALNAIHSKFLNLNKSKSRNNKACLYLKEEFDALSFPHKLVTTDPTTSTHITTNVEAIIHESTITSVEESVEPINTSTTIITRQLEEYTNKIETMNITLRNQEMSYSNLKSKLNHVKTLNKKLESQIMNLNKSLENKSKKLRNVKKELHHIKTGAFYQRVRRRNKRLEAREKVMTNLQQENEKMQQFKSKIKLLKKNLCNQKKLTALHLSAKTALKKEKSKFIEMIRNLEAEILFLKSDCNIVKTKSKGNIFNSNIELCVMELVGELEVSSTKCSRVIQTISKWLFNQKLDTSALPSQSTVINMMDRAQVLSKFQVAEELVNTERFDIHSDGTSRDHVKILGQQITLDDGRTLSAGFSMISKEDSCTLLDNAIGMLSEVADMHTQNEFEKETLYKEILSKLFALMADRANVNKAFYKKMQNYMQTELGNGIILHFLHCNAHFLLGLSTACEITLKGIEKIVSAEIGHPLGRDNDPKFKYFKNGSESSAARYIRTACDVFGPRGDEKNGCKQEWKAFCEAKLNKISRITSFRMNRFNNFFEGAAALVFHVSDIQDFLSHFRGNLNLKLASVLSDSLSTELQALIRAVGIIYYKVTGPFWKMLHGDVEYVDLHLYVQSMLACFRDWSKDATPLLLVGSSIFPAYDLNVKGDGVFESLLNSKIESREHLLTKSALEQIMEAFITVTERQLADFLPGGRYGQTSDEKTRNCMKHCKLTNLIGENEFGDLDYSQFKRRHASMHYHSSVEMVKRNKTISSWMYNKSEEERLTLLKLGKQKAKRLREKHRTFEKEILVQIKNRLEENFRKKQEAEAEKLGVKKKLIDDVKRHGGPCLKKRDVDKVLKNCTTHGNKIIALKNEFKYLKIVLGVKDKRLLLGKKDVQVLKEDLIAVLSSSEAENCSRVVNAIDNDYTDSSSDVELAGPSAISGLESKRKNNLGKENQNTESNNGNCETNTLTSYDFTKQGEWVAVAYEDEFYIGEVSQVYSNQLAQVQFLTKSLNKTFKWPQVDDVANIESKFVFASDFEVTYSGRSMLVPELKDLQDLYDQFQALYFIDNEF